MRVREDGDGRNVRERYLKVTSVSCCHLMASRTSSLENFENSIFKIRKIRKIRNYKNFKPILFRYHMISGMKSPSTDLT